MQAWSRLDAFFLPLWVSQSLSLKPGISESVSVRGMSPSAGSGGSARLLGIGRCMF